jgi:hypothetical protein
VRRYFKKACEETKVYIAPDTRGLFSFFVVIVTAFAINVIVGFDLAFEYAVEIFINTVITGGMFVLVLYVVNLIRSPFIIIAEQDKIISTLSDIKSRKQILSQLTQLRKSGVALRNRGYGGLVHEKSIAAWWNEHLAWREATANTIELLNENIANKWRVLGTYTIRRPYPKALNQDHRHKLQMFDAWLERLDDVIENFMEKVKSDGSDA